MKRYLSLLIILGALAGLMLPQGHTVSAAPGMPGSAEFGYGAWINLQGSQFNQALSAAVDLQLDWLAVDLDWSLWMPTAATTPDTQGLDEVFRIAKNNGIAVMLSFRHAPAWAMTTSGPSADLTNQVLQWLCARYGETLQAIEVFPGANTSAGWGTSPSGAAYASLFTSIKKQFESANIKTGLIAGGLDSAPQVNSETAMTDIDFLRALYTNGARDWMNILSLQLTGLSGDPLNAPDKPASFRHYEAIRQIMAEYQHTNSMIWITRINIPDGTINKDDSFYNDSLRQAEWLQQALLQVRSQLYIGVAYLQNLNAPAISSTSSPTSCLIQPGLQAHPFYSVLKTYIQETKPSEGALPPGLQKASSTSKSPNAP
ncbi:MAG TPA: hypothetical protein PKD23_08840 [Bellilinea sp.]|nr:hypothetical protein [Bellilinea sp.]